MVVALVGCASAPPPSPTPPPTSSEPATAPQPEVSAPAGEPSATAPPAQAARTEERAAEPTNTQPDAEALIQEGIAIMREIASRMEGIVDEATARAAAPGLMELTRKAEGFKARFDAIKESVPGDQRQALKKKYETQLAEAMKKLVQETKRVMQLPGAADALRGMRPQ
jgi:hypothetical protein